MNIKFSPVSYFSSMPIDEYVRLLKVATNPKFRTDEDKKIVEYHIERLKDVGMASNELEARFLIHDVLNGWEPSSRADISKRQGNVNLYLTEPRKRFKHSAWKRVVDSYKVMPRVISDNSMVVGNLA